MYDALVLIPENLQMTAL